MPCSRARPISLMAQELSHTGSFGWQVATGEIIWTAETFRVFGYDRATKPSLQLIVERTHPEDREAVQKTIDQASREQTDFEHEYRLLMPDGSVKARPRQGTRDDQRVRQSRIRRSSDGHHGRKAGGAAATPERDLSRRGPAFEPHLEAGPGTCAAGTSSTARPKSIACSASIRNKVASAEEIQSRIPAEDLEMLGEVVRQAVRSQAGTARIRFSDIAARRRDKARPLGGASRARRRWRLSARSSVHISM